MTKEQAEKIADALEGFIAARAICLERPHLHDDDCKGHRLETRNSLTAALAGPPEWPQDVDAPQQVVADRTGA